MKLYNSYCCSIYCCALVPVHNKTILDKLPVACKKVFKSLMGVPRAFSASDLFVSLNVCNFAPLRSKLVDSFLNRIRPSSNSLICTLFNSVNFETCMLKKNGTKFYKYKVEHYDNEVPVTYVWPVTDGLVLRAGVSVTWNVLSWSGGHEFKTPVGSNLGWLVLLS